jgi:hypothetical protein
LRQSQNKEKQQRNTNQTKEITKKKKTKQNKQQQQINTNQAYARTMQHKRTITPAAIPARNGVVVQTG